MESKEHAGHQFKEFEIVRFDDAIHGEAAARAALKSFSDYCAKSGGTLALPTVEAWRDDMKSSQFGFVATENCSPATVVGSIFISIRDEFATISPLSVHPDFASKGIGTELIRVAIKFANERGINEIRLSTDDFNRQALAVYLKAGFQPVETVYHIGGFPTTTTTSNNNNNNNADLDLLGGKFEARRMCLDDVDDCDALFQKTKLAKTRKNEIKNCVETRNDAMVLLDRSDQGRIVAFATGLTVGGFWVASTADAFKAIFTAAAHEISSGHIVPIGPAPVIQLPARLYPEVLSWAISSGLRIHELAQQLRLSNTPYEDISKDVIYMPSCEF